MIARARVGLFAALVTLASIFLAGSCHGFAPPTRPSSGADLDAGRDQARSPDQERRRAQRRQAAGAAAPRRRRGVPEERRPQRRGAARPDRRGCAERERELAAPRPRHHAALVAERARAPRAAGARRDRRLHRLSARRQPQRGGRQPQRRSAGATASAASGGPRSTRCGCRSSCARWPTCARSTRRCARITASACSTIRSTRIPPRRAPASSSPRSCPAKRTDFSPFVARRRHGQARALRRGEAALRRRPQARRALQRDACAPACRRPCKETLSKSADLTIYVRDRKPFARFAGKAYVLPRTGQRGIPVVSVNTKAVNIAVYRISDRNLIETVLGRDFQRNLEPYDIERLTESRAIKVWNGELAVEQTLNTDVTTAFPVDQAVGDMAAGVYVMTADVKGNSTDTDDPISTQWFIVSDMGLSAYSGSDGINVFVNSLATTEPKGQIEVRLMSRGNEVLGTKRSDAQRPRAVRGRACRAARARCRPPCWSPPTRSGDYGFLNLKGPAFDLSDRGVAGRPPVAGLDAFVYTERGVYRSGETVHITVAAARCAGRRRGRRAADAGGRAAGRPRISPHRGRRPGRRRLFAERADQLGGLDRHLAGARLHRSEASGGRRDHLPGRRLCAGSPRVRSRGAGRADRPRHADQADRRRPLSLRRAGLEPRSRRRGDRSGRQGAAGPCRLQVRHRRRGRRNRPPAARGPAADRRQGQGELRGRDREDAADHAAARGAGDRAAGRIRRPRGRAQDHAAGRCRRQHDRREAAVLRPLARRGRDRDLRRRRCSRPTARCSRRAGLRYELLKIEQRYQWYRRDGRWDYEPIKLTRRVADGRLDVAADQAGRISAPVQWGRYRLEVVERRRQRAGHLGRLRRRLLRGSDGRHAGPAGDRARQAGVQAGRGDDRRGHRAHRGPRHRQRDGRQAPALRHPGRAGRHRPHPRRCRLGLGHRRLCGGDLAPSARRARAAHAGPRHRRAVVLDRPQGAHARGRHEAAAADPAEHEVARADQDRRPRLDRSGARRGRRRRRRHPQSHQLQAAGAGRLSISASASSPAEIRDLYGQLIDGMQGTRGADPHRRRRGRRSSTAARRRRRRSRSIPASSMSAPAAPRSSSTFRPSPAPSASWRWPGARTRSAAPTATSRCAIRWCSPRPCRASCSPATAAP